MKTLTLAALVLFCGLACGKAEPMGPNIPKDAVHPSLPPELVDQRMLSEVARYLYRWYVDEADIEQASTSPDLILWIGLSTPPLDEGDKSIFATIHLPCQGITVQLKKADYFIEETKMSVKSSGFKITSVSRGQVPPALPAGYAEIKMDMEKLKEHLFATRHQLDFPQDILIKRLKAELVAELAQEKISVTDDPVVAQTIYVGSLSPLANDLWAYWENKKWLVHCTSDIDLANPAVWSQEHIRIRWFDTFTQVVVSMEEAAGSNRFMTRDQIGRALYNCIVLGKRIQMAPAVPELAKPKILHHR